MKPPEIAIQILAAGASSRMDGLKQLLPWKGTVLINHMVRTALATDASEVLVVLGAHAAEIREAIDDANRLTILEHDKWQLGMGSTISFGMEYYLKSEVPPDGVLFMLCDQPLMDATYLNGLIAQFKKGDKGIIATRYGDRTGVPALFSAVYFPKLLKLNADYGARELLARYKEDCKLMEAGRKVTDVDTQKDYRQLLSDL